MTKVSNSTSTITPTSQLSQPIHSRDRVVNANHTDLDEALATHYNGNTPNKAVSVVYTGKPSKFAAHSEDNGIKQYA